MVLIGAAERPRVTLLTALPLVWGEGDPADVLAGRAGRSATLVALDKEFDIRAIDVVSAETLGRGTAMIAQPRRLTAEELVVLDRWVRKGGHALIFADPELVWPSRYALGDVRRPPPVTLLDPLFAHWGVKLGDSDKGERVARSGGLTLATATAGTWQGPKGCRVPDPLVLDCPIGRGRVILVGDADLLDARLWEGANADNPAWIALQLHALAGESPRESNRGGFAWAIAAILAGGAFWTIISRRFGGT